MENMLLSPLLNLTLLLALATLSVVQDRIREWTRRPESLKQ